MNNSPTPRYDALIRKWNSTETSEEAGEVYAALDAAECEVAALREACQAARKVLDETRQTFGINLPATFEVIEKIDRALKSQFAQGASEG